MTDGLYRVSDRPHLVPCVISGRLLSRAHGLPPLAPPSSPPPILCFISIGTLPGSGLLILCQPLVLTYSPLHTCIILLGRFDAYWPLVQSSLSLHIHLSLYPYLSLHFCDFPLLPTRFQRSSHLSTVPPWPAALPSTASIPSG